MQFQPLLFGSVLEGLTTKGTLACLHKCFHQTLLQRIPLILFLSIDPKNGYMGHSAGLSRDEMHYLGYSNIPEREEVHIMVDQKKIVCADASLCFFVVVF